MSGFGYVGLDQQTQTQTKISNNPGAWMFDGTNNNRWPILHSTTDVNTTNMFLTDETSYTFKDTDDAWFVLPGFKCEVYLNSNYSGVIKSTYDNTYGTTVLVKKTTSPNDVASIKLFYKGTQL